MSEFWLPDPVERCQDALRRAWYQSPVGDCWYLSRSALERFFQEDSAGNELPPEWLRLLALANLPPDAAYDLPFTSDDFERLATYSRRLGDALNLTPSAQETPELPAPPRATPRNNYAFAAVIVLAAFIGMAVYTNRLLGNANDARLSLLRRMSVAQADLQHAAARIQDISAAHENAQKQLAALEVRNAELKAKIRPEKPEVPGIDLRPLIQARNAGQISGWDVRTPSYTAVEAPPREFTWPRGANIAASVLIFEQATQKRVGRIWTNLADGHVKAPLLLRGHTYQWAVVAEGEDKGYSAVPFYILSQSEHDRLSKALHEAKTDSERAALTAKFGLFDQLVTLSAAAKRRLALE